MSPNGVHESVSVGKMIHGCDVQKGFFELPRTDSQNEVFTTDNLDSSFSF